jgi:hypothetical protein
MPVREVSGVNPTRDGGNKPGEGAEPFRVSELVHDIGGAADVEDAANRTIKHALDLTGARWAAILEPRSPDMPGVLATTDSELTLEMLRLGELSSRRLEWPVQRPAADQISPSRAGFAAFEPEAPRHCPRRDGRRCLTSELVRLISAPLSM